MSGALLFIVAAALIAAGGFFAAAETAITSLPVSDIRAIADRDRRRAQALRAIADAPAVHASACGFLRVLAESTAAVCVTLAFASLMPTLWAAALVSAAVMTLASFVLVGASPRSFGATNPEGVLRGGARLVHGARLVIGPVASTLTRIAGSRRSELPTGVDAGETRLMHLVDKAMEQDVIEQGERELIHSVVEFGDTITRSVMVPRTDMVTASPDDTVDETLGVLLSSGFSRLPVIGHEVDDVVGMVFLRDLARHVRGSRGEARQTPITALVRPVSLVPESKPVDALLREMQLTHQHMAVVIDEYGSVAGLVTLEDLIEELVGEISDEHDHSQPEYVDLGRGRFRVSARLGVSELGELFDLELDDDEVDSVGGLFVKTLGRLPLPHERVSVSGLRLTAARVDLRSRRLLTVLAEREPTRREQAHDQQAHDQQAHDQGANDA